MDSEPRSRPIHSGSLRARLFGAILVATILPACAEDSTSNGRQVGNANDDDDDAKNEPDPEDEGDDEPPATSKDAGKTPAKVDAGRDSDAPTSALDAGAGKDAGSTRGDGSQPSTGDTGAPSGTDSGAGDAAVEPSGELCELKPYQVGVLGDSYIDLSGDFTKFVEENARKADALGASEHYIDLAKSGAAMQSGNLLAPAIPTQLPTLLSTSKLLGPEGVKLVLMTGGGNDVLIDNPDCKTLSTVNDKCKAVVAKTLAVIKKLFVDMKAAGIKEVVYFWYPDLGPLQGRVINDYSIPIAKEQCETDPSVRCHFVDTREAFKGHADFVSLLDGIHPTANGSKAIADLVWKVMVDNCLGSK